MNPEPIFDLAHLGHMGLLTPKPEQSLKFFVDDPDLEEFAPATQQFDMRYILW